jgi:hypothetical protein
MADRGDNSLDETAHATREEKRLIFELRLFPSERMLFSSRRRKNESMVVLEEVEEREEPLPVRTEKLVVI